MLSRSVATGLAKKGCRTPRKPDGRSGLVIRLRGSTATLAQLRSRFVSLPHRQYSCLQPAGMRLERGTARITGHKKAQGSSRRHYRDSHPPSTGMMVPCR